METLFYSVTALWYIASPIKRQALKMKAKLRTITLVGAMSTMALYSSTAVTSGIPSYHLIGMPKATVACRYDVEDNDCTPVVLSKERIVPMKKHKRKHN